MTFKKTKKTNEGNFLKIPNYEKISAKFQGAASKANVKPTILGSIHIDINSKRSKHPGFHCVFLIDLTAKTNL